MRSVQQGEEQNPAKLFQPKDIVHGVKPRRLFDYPFGSAERATGKGVAGMSSVGNFNPFTRSPKEDGMITDDISSSYCLHADFAGFAFSGYSLSGIYSDFLEIPFHPIS